MLILVLTVFDIFLIGIYIWLYKMYYKCYEVLLLMDSVGDKTREKVKELEDRMYKAESEICGFYDRVTIADDDALQWWLDNGYMMSKDMCGEWCYEKREGSV